MNNNSYFWYQEYGKKNDKNQWNCVCSCMDWIEFSLEYIVKKSDFSYCNMEIYAYISSIDIIFESIKQLHRVFIDSKTIPFKGEKKYFADSTLKCDDNDIFKEIRAAFGAHAVDIRRDKAKKYFASYPTNNNISDYDFSVMLYSHNLEEEDIEFGFKLSELNEFLKSRYSYLSVFLEIKKKLYLEFCKRKEKEKIEESDNLKKQLKILEQASKKRLDNDYYREIIERLKRIVNVECTSDKNKILVDKYMSHIRKCMDELYNNLQNMIFEELKNDVFYYKIPIKIQYSISKFLSNKQDNISFFYIEEIKNFFKNDIEINESMKYDEIYLLVSAVLYFYTKNNNKLIDKKFIKIDDINKKIIEIDDIL